jgi:hypothetical protein
MDHGAVEIEAEDETVLLNGHENFSGREGGAFMA